MLEGYRDPKPMVFCGLYPVDGDEYADLREALEKLRLNDSSFTYEPETSGALGFGFRCGFLGLLHMEIVRERLEREYDLSLVATAPNVEYLAPPHRWVEIVDNPSSMPPPTQIDFVEEPYVTITVLTPTEYVGAIMELAQAGAASSTRWSTSPRSGSSSSTDPAGRDRHGLLRPAEVADPGLREPRLRARRVPALELVKVDVMLNAVPGRRVLDDRAPRQGVRLRQDA